MRIRGIIKIFPMLHVYSILSVQKQFAKISSNTILMPLPGSITEIKNSWSMRVTSLEASLHMRPFSGPTPQCFSVHLPLSSTTLTTLSSTDKSCHIYVDQCQHCHKILTKQDRVVLKMSLNPLPLVCHPDTLSSSLNVSILWINVKMSYCEYQNKSWMSSMLERSNNLMLVVLVDHSYKSVFDTAMYFMKQML